MTSNCSARARWERVSPPGSPWASERLDTFPHRPAPSRAQRSEVTTRGLAAVPAVPDGSDGTPPLAAPPEATERPSFEGVYAQNADFVWRSLARLGVPESGLPDAMQEVFLVAYRRLGDFEGRSQVKTWLFG